MANKPNLVKAIGNELSTTLSANVTDSATSMTVADATGFDADGGYIIIDEGVADKEEVAYVESISGNTLTISDNGRGLAGTTAVAHTSGATVTDILVTDHIEGIRSKFLDEHNDDGTHSDISASSIVLPNTTPTIDGSIGFDRTNEDLVVGDGANSQKIHMGEWKAWTPTWTNLTVGNGTVNAKYTQVGKTIFFRADLTLGSTSSVGTNPSISFPETLATYAVNQYLGQIAYRDGSGDNIFTGPLYSNGLLLVHTLPTGVYIRHAAISASIPLTWASGHSIALWGFGEAA